MADMPTTRPSLVIRLRDHRDNDAWQQFVQVYAPLVYRFARRRGLQDADAADLTQEVLGAVSTSVAGLEYDPRRGLFRSWLYTLAHRRLCDFLTRQQKLTVGSGDSQTIALLKEVPAADEDIWNKDYKSRLFHWAAEQARSDFSESTWQAFWQTSVAGRDPGQVALELGVSIGAVYVAKSRVQSRLRQLVREVEED
jgi:RNA polymerase sigma-70 factor (ECF subfamily)